MSELINNNPAHISALTNFAARLISGENGRALINEYSADIESVDPFDTMSVFDNLLKGDYSLAEVKANTGKILNVFYKSLAASDWEQAPAGHYLSWLMEENRGAEKLLNRMRESVKIILSGGAEPDIRAIGELARMLDELGEYELHYIKKENILFPYIEKVFHQNSCLRLMWSFHDDFRESLRTLRMMTASGPVMRDKLNKEIGRLFFTVFPVIFREERIIFPIALKVIPSRHWDEMLEQSNNAGWCFGVRPETKESAVTPNTVPEALLDFGTGSLSPGQVIMLMNHLPLEITFVDANDEVRYFSGGKHQIFHRSKAILGRKVQNCHPPASVHIVNDIIESFRNGSRDHADFWIKMKERLIYIRYFAIRNSEGTYEGTMELTQDVTTIRSLEGERRLPQWEG